MSPSSAGVGPVNISSIHADGVMHSSLVQAERLERDGDAYVTRCMAAFQHEVAAMLPGFLQPGECRASCPHAATCVGIMLMRCRMLAERSAVCVPQHLWE